MGGSQGGEAAGALREGSEEPPDPFGLAYGEGSYERIGYTLEDRDGRSGLAVLPVDKGWGPNFLRMGLRLSDDFAGRNGYQLIGEANFTGLNALGGESRNRIELGRITGHVGVEDLLDTIFSSFCIGK